MSAEPQATNLEAPAPAPKSRKPIQWTNPFRQMLDNPVILKELRGRMRGRQAFVLLTVYLGLIAILISIIYAVLAEQSSYSGWDPSFRQSVGKSIFGAVVLLELLLVSFIGPGLTAGAITSEREHQTFDLLRTTLLSASSLVIGKLGSAFTYLFLLILTALPIQSIAFLLGGVGMGEMVVSSLLLVVTAAFYCSLGIFFSSFMKRTLTATITAYGTIVVSVLLLVITFFVFAYFQSFSYNNPNSAREFILNIILWFLISTNPFLTAIMSEVILVEEQSLFITKNMLFGGNPSLLLSPWIIYTVIYILLTLLIIFLSIQRVKRPDR